MIPTQIGEDMVEGFRIDRTDRINEDETKDWRVILDFSCREVHIYMQVN
jgi:hypothetical protein